MAPAAVCLGECTNLLLKSFVGGFHLFACLCCTFDWTFKCAEKNINMSSSSWWWQILSKRFIFIMQKLCLSFVDFKLIFSTENIIYFWHFFRCVKGNKNNWIYFQATRSRKMSSWQWWVCAFSLSWRSNVLFKFISQLSSTIAGVWPFLVTIFWNWTFVSPQFDLIQDLIFLIFPCQLNQSTVFKNFK